MKTPALKFLMWVCIVGVLVLGAHSIATRDWRMIPSLAVSLFFSVATLRAIKKKEPSHD
jgi:hypothetical protein